LIGKVIVHINGTGEVTGCDYYWRRIGKVERVIRSLRSEESIRSSVSEFAQRFGDSIVTVTDFRFGYFEEGLRRSQRFLQPVFVLIVTITNAGRRFTKKTVLVLPAAVDSIGNFMPPPKAPTRPRMRRPLPND
jgi:hypothetical protein